eukprot:14004834-Ditylum_brightwellii.AAC.1
MNDRTIGAIELGPSFNLQDGYKFLNISTGKLINRRDFTELPILDSIIKKIKNMAEQEGQVGTIFFTNRTGKEIKDILLSDEYEDWPGDTIPTGADLTTAQDQHQTLSEYIAENEEDIHAEPVLPPDNDLVLGPPPLPDNKEVNGTENDIAPLTNDATTMSKSNEENAITPPINDEKETSEPNKETPIIHKDKEDMTIDQHGNLPTGVLEGETAG